MRFTRISLTKKAVELNWTTKQPDGTSITHVLTSPDKPLPAFSNALQAFSGWALQLIEAPATWDDVLRVTTINFHEDKNGRRGFQVSFSKKVERARGASFSLTTPTMWEADSIEGEIADGFYGEWVVEQLSAVEAEATRFQAGEREQGEIFAKGDDQEQPKTPGRSRPKKNRDFIPGVGPIANPDATEEPTDDNLRQLLLRAGRDVPVDAIARWTSGERDSAQRWSTEIIAAALKGQKPRATYVEPECVKRDGTLPLIQDDKKPAAAAGV